MEKDAQRATEEHQQELILEIQCERCGGSGNHGDCYSCGGTGMRLTPDGFKVFDLVMRHRKNILLGD